MEVTIVPPTAPLEEDREGNQVHARFKGASWYKHPQQIVLGGAGGIGSWLSLFLSRAGHEVNIYDFDIIEEHNIGGQFYEVGFVGAFKVDTLTEVVERFGGKPLTVWNEKYTPESMISSVAISCFDNMEARKVMVQRWWGWYSKMKEAGPDRFASQPFIFIDGRLNAETAELFCVTDEKSYEKYMSEWFDDSKVEDAPCTFKATSHCAAILAGMMVSALNNKIANHYDVSEMRSVPYKTSIWLPTMMTLTEEL